MDENIQKILKEKQYYQEGENSWEDICSRVSTAIAEAEETDKNKLKTQQEIYDSMVKMDFIFSTPCLLNANKDNPGQLSSCFITETRDNIEDICKMDAEFAKIFQRNGGVGTDLSVLRPAKSEVLTSKGYAGGIITFMHKYDSTADEMTKFNPSRKGAIKINLQVWHPQVKDFIHCKDDTNQLQRMNISLSFDDRFMEAVKNDFDWDLEFPDYSFNKEIYNTEWNGNLQEWKDRGYPTKVYYTIKARELFREFCESSWKTGEPGVNLQSRMNIDNMNPHLSKLVYTNPCLHKDSYMVTENGLEKISKLKSKIWNGEKYTPTTTMKTGVKKVIRLMTKSGFEYVVTPDHKFKLTDDSWVEAKDTIGKNIKFDLREKTWVGHNPHPEVDYRILGFEFGDGTFHKASNRMKYIYAGIENEKEVIELIEKEFNDKFYQKQGTSWIINIPYNTVYANAFSDRIEHRLIPDWIMRLPKKEMADFLQGLFSANGCNLKKYNKIQLTSMNREMLKQVQQMLLLFGIKAKLWYHSKKQNIEFPNGEYECKQTCHIVISRNSYKKFLDEISFIHTYKQGYDTSKKLKDEDNFETVILISELDEEEVWDFSEPNLHQGICSGAYVHNCNEFTNIPYSSCNLGSINLLNCVEKGKFSYDKLSRLTKQAIRWLDNMITVNKLPLGKIDEVTKQIRPVGLGIMGLADAMYALKIKYNSSEGHKFAEKIIKTMKSDAVLSSMELAAERGIYPAWEGSVWEQKKIHIRNSNLLSIAPTGTISFIAGVSGGCEPNFALTYSRRTYEGNLYYITNKIFEEELKKRNIYSTELMQKIEKNHGSCQGVSEVPLDMQEVFVTAHDLTPKEHVDMVAVLQKHVDLSLSKTVNFSNNASIDDIYNIYLYAWEQGLKGLSVYRDGCRENQTLATHREDDKKPISIDCFDCIEPVTKETLGETYGSAIKRKVACGNLHINLFRDKSGNLAEIFVNTSKGGVCQSNINALSRLISLALRSGVKVDEIVDQISNIKCPACTVLKAKGEKIEGMSCPDAIGKYISEKYILGDTIIKEHKPKAKKKNSNIDKSICPNCGEKMRAESGCWSCRCGFSRCG